MKIKTSELPVYCDVDETLVRNFTVERKSDQDIELMYYDQKVYARPIQEHIDLLKSYKSRGYSVTVWSANGFRWAKEVVTRLDLVQFVDEVASKPLKFIDDKPADQWMQRIFLL